MKKLFTGFVVLLVLSASSVAQNIPSYVPLSGLVGWWPFDGNGNDLSLQANNATNFGATFTSDRFGNPNSAVSFNGLSAYMQVATPGFSLDETGEFTYSVWVKKQVQPSSGVVVMSGNNTTGNFISNVQGMNDIQFGTNKQQSAWIWLSCQHTLQVWDHIVATYNAGTMKLYKNGVYQSMTTYTHTGAITAVQTLWFGRGPGGNNYKGDADDVGIWNRELTQAEISELFTGCALAITSQPASQTCNLMGVARFIVAVNSPTATYIWQTNQGAGFQNVTNGGQYNGANNDTLFVYDATMANNNQMFRCRITDGSCFVLSDVGFMTVNNTVGVDGISASQQIRIFPNPATDLITITVLPETAGQPYILTNNLGKPVLNGILTSETITLDLSHLSSGLYFFSIPSRPGSAIKFQKQ